MTSPPRRAGLVVERLRVRVLEVPVAEAVPMSFSHLAGRRVCLVEVHAGGLVGVGESWLNYPPWGVPERLATVCDGIGPLLVGRDLTDGGEPAYGGLAVTRTYRDLVERLVAVARQCGAPGPVWQAISGVDLALWDLAGKVTGRPVAALLGAGEPLRVSVPVYGSGVGPTGVAELSERALALGLRAVKVKVGFGRERDEATLATAREVTGDGVRLFADANQAWTLPEAVEMCRVLSAYGVEWVEEPLDDDALDNVEKLCGRSGMTLGIGENLYGVERFTRYLGSPAVAQIQPDVAKTGGMSLAREVAARARAVGTGVSPHCYSGPVGIVASVHLGAANRAVHWVELDLRDNPLRTDLPHHPLCVENGELVVPAEPGLGPVLDEQTVIRYQICEQERRLT